ncbi:MAG: hypothetical protein D6813_00855, partial [Calditrichaeota bacterium]
MRKLFFLIIVLTVVISGCKQSTEPQPVDAKPPGYQEDIPWPSLADSPWPTFGADAQNTFRAKSDEIIQGNIDWSSDLINNEFGIVVGKDSTIYVAANPTGTGKLIAFSSEGNIKWEVVLDNSGVMATPVVLANGDVLCLTLLSFHLISSSGVKIRTIPHAAGNYYPTPKINISHDGDIIYVSGSNTLNSLSLEGNINFTFRDSTGLYWDGRMAFSPDGKKLYLTGSGLTCFNLETIKIDWILNKENTYRGIMVESGGNILSMESIPDDRASKLLTMIDKDGNKLWQYKFHYAGFSNISIDRNGNIYFGNPLKSVTFYGKFRWELNTGHGIMHPVLNNNSLFTVYRGNDNSLIVQNYSFDGNINWTVEKDSCDYYDGKSPSIAFGRL